MNIIDIPLQKLKGAPWNPNRMDKSMMDKLQVSMDRFGLVENLVVRPLGDGTYEVLSSNQRLKLLCDQGVESVACVAVTLDDAQARLLSQALNRIQGEDDMGLKAELLQKVLDSLPQEDVLALLPETSRSLQALSSLGQETMAEHLQAWQKAQNARLKHLRFQLSTSQLNVVEEALMRVRAKMKGNPSDHNPNIRGTALYLLCKAFLEEDGV